MTGSRIMAVAALVAFGAPAAITGQVQSSPELVASWLATVETPPHGGGSPYASLLYQVTGGASEIVADSIFAELIPVALDEALRLHTRSAAGVMLSLAEAQRPGQRTAEIGSLLRTLARSGDPVFAQVVASLLLNGSIQMRRQTVGAAVSAIRSREIVATGSLMVLVEGLLNGGPGGRQALRALLQRGDLPSGKVRETAVGLLARKGGGTP